MTTVTDTPVSDAATEPATDLSLPSPRRSSNALMELLQRRRSARAFASQSVDDQLLADILWAASGITNRQGYRTAPSARNWREIDIYIATAQGLFLFNPAGNKLIAVLGDDVRALTGQQEYAASAPVTLIYVADFARMGGASPREQDFYSAADTGVIVENVYLCCAALGLATVVRGLIDRTSLAGRMRLRATQHVTLAQSIGHPLRP